MGNKKPVTAAAPAAAAAPSSSNNANASLADKKKALKKAQQVEQANTIKKAGKSAMDDIFAALSAPPTPAADAPTATAGGKNGKGQLGQKRDRGDGGKANGDKKKEKASEKGLYKAPEAEDEFDMGDDLFFSRDGGTSVRRTEEGLRLMTEDEIVKATNAGSKKAGTTIHCPFDCDCCF